VAVDSFKLVGERVNATGVEGSVGVNRVGQAQAVGLDAQPEAKRVAGEPDVAAVGTRGAGDLLPAGGREDAGARGRLVTTRKCHDAVAVARFEADDLHRRLPERPFDPVPRLDVSCQGSTPVRPIGQGIDKTRRRCAQRIIRPFVILPEEYAVMGSVKLLT
jgi:hypothetical protein